MRSILLVPAAFAMTSVPLIAHAGNLRIAKTPSGYAEMAFEARDAATVRNLIASVCLKLNWTVVRSADMEIVCETPSNETTRIYPTQPQTWVDFSLMGMTVKVQKLVSFAVSEGGHRRTVTARAYRLIPDTLNKGYSKAFIESDGVFNGLMDVMALAGGTFSAGTQLGRLPWFGFEVEHVINTEIDGKKRMALRIGDVTDKGPAAAAGLKTRDVVVAVNGKGFKSSEALGALLRGVAPNSEFTLDVLRNGQNLILKGTARDQPELSATY